jgi:lipoprotein-anchoring transpeptidase ErfK/SrfK
MRLLAAAALVLAAAAAAAAPLEARIDLSDQRMTIIQQGQVTHRWPVSTARAGKFTPTGLFSVKTMKRMHYSTIYNNAPMPWSIFFHGNFAIHGTDQVERLGRPASAGCVRLHPEHAEILYRLVQDYGRAETLIEIVK